METLNLLLIEDSLGDARFIFETIKEVKDIDIQVTHSVKLSRAIEYLRIKKFDAILLGIDLQDSSGLLILEKLFQNNSTIPIIIITREENKEDAIKAVQMGAQDYLLKFLTDGNTLVRSLKYAIERKRFQQIVSQSEENYRNLVEYSPDAILVHHDKKVIYTNKSCLKLFGAKDANELINKKITHLLHPDFVKYVEEHISNTLETGNISHLKEQKGIKLDGTIIDVNVMAMPVVFKGKEVVQVILRNITDEKMMERQLQHRLAIEEIVALISKNFINISTKEIDSEINKSLKIIGEFSKVDRSYIFQFSDGCTFANNTHEWCNVGISPQINNLQHIPCSFSPWLMARLSRFEEVQLETTSALPPGEEKFREMIEAQDIKSMIIVPMYYKNELFGFWGFDSVKEYKKWDKEDIVLLGTLSEVFANALMRKKHEKLTEEALHLIKSITDITPDILFIYDIIEKKKIYSNKDFINELGYSSREFAKTAYDAMKYLVHEEDFANVDKSVKSIREGKPVQAEFRVKKADGSLNWYYARSVIFSKTPEGLPKQILIIFEDITIRRFTEEALRNSEQNLAQMFKITPLVLGISTLDEGKYVFINDAFENMLEHKRAEVLGHTSTELNILVDVDREKVMQELKEKGTITNFEMKLRTRSGKIKIGLASAALIRYNNATCLLTAISDITQRKRIESALQESEIRFRDTFEQAAIGIAHISINGKWLRKNKTFCEMLGYSCEELTKLNYDDISLPGEVKRNQAYLNQITSGVIKNISFEQHLIKHDSSQLWVNTTLSLSSDKTNNENYLIAIFKNITEQKHIEKTLWETTLRLSVIFKEIPSAIAITRIKDRKIIEINPAFEKISGYSPEEVLGRTPDELNLFPDPDLREKIFSILKKNGVVRNLEIKANPKSGKQIVILASISKIEMEGVDCLIVVASDITEKNKYLNRLNEYVKELNKHKLALEENTKILTELNSAKDKLFTIISHDLRSPFSALLGLSEFLSKNISEFSEEEIKAYAHDIHKSLSSLLKLMENLLHWSSIQTGREEFNPQFFNFYELVNEVINIYSVNASNKNLKIINDVDICHIVFADKNMIEAVVRNLISNAIKFTPTGGSVTIGLSEKNEIAEITVADTGIGIVAEDVDKLFKFGEVILYEGTMGEKGTGLGLALCKEFIEQNQGKIRVESINGHGSKFVFTLHKTDFTKKD